MRKMDREVEERLPCPHCGVLCELVTVACQIFRCGEFKTDGKSIPPHASKELCDYYVQNNLIWGCGKPFKFNKEKRILEICDYI